MCTDIIKSEDEFLEFIPQNLLGMYGGVGSRNSSRTKHLCLCANTESDRNKCTDRQPSGHAGQGVCACGPYLLEDLGGYESAARVEGAGAADVQVSLVERLQHAQEVGALQLDKQRSEEGQRMWLNVVQNLKLHVRQSDVKLFTQKRFQICSQGLYI